MILRELRPDTQYQVIVTAVVNGKNYKSRRIVFKTANASKDYLELESAKSTFKPPNPRKHYSYAPELVNPDPTAIGSKNTPQTSTTVSHIHTYTRFCFEIFIKKIRQNFIFTG